MGRLLGPLGPQPQERQESREVDQPLSLVAFPVGHCFAAILAYEAITATPVAMTDVA